MASSALYHFRSEMYLCEVCNIKFTMKTHLQNHCKTHHPANGEWSPRFAGTKRKGHLTCIDCDVSFGDEKKLKAHRQTHTGSNQYACEECNAMFVTEEGLQSHADLHKMSRFACSRCDMDFSHSIFLKLHCEQRHQDLEPMKGNNHFNHFSDACVASHPLDKTKSGSRLRNGYEVEFSFQKARESKLTAHVST